MLFNLHYLIVAFFLTVVIGLPEAPTIVLVLHYVFQTIYFVLGGAIIDDVEFWAWQALVTFSGIVAAILFIWATRAPTILQFKVGFESAWFLQVPLALAALIGGQVLYAEFAPPATWYGLFFTIVLNAIVLLLLWMSLLSNDVIFRKYESVTGFFVGWILIQVSMQAAFYFTYTGLRELWVAFIAAGAGILFSLILLLFCRPATSIKTAETDTEAFIENKVM